jgi:hypothetical protein
MRILDVAIDLTLRHLNEMKASKLREDEFLSSSEDHYHFQIKETKNHILSFLEEKQYF